MSCLQVNVRVVPLAIKPTVSLYCSVGSVYFPLLVEEGYLFVKENDITYYLCVDKEFHK